MRYEVEQSLLGIGERICRTDYAVRHYRDKQHPKFYGKSEQLLKALRRAIPGLPKKTRSYYIRWIDAVLLDGAPLNPNRRYESCGEIIADEERLQEALLRLPEDTLERLIIDAGNALVDMYNSHLRGYTGDEANCWMEAFWMEAVGVGMLPDDPSNSSNTDYQWRKTVPSLRDNLSKQLCGKSHARTLQRLSIGLIEMVDYLKGQSLNPFWYYYDIALMVESRLPVKDR
ncbi:hypothetical protein HAP94_02045 [Acidithiobacillus ferrivorans]|nr:hypothetical protein [Acidithiobacillus ferrivorans]